MSAMIASAVVGGISSSKAASTQASAARDAGNLQAQAARDQIASQERMFERQIELQEPWRQAGINALGQLTSPETRLPAAFTSQTQFPSQFKPEAQYALPKAFTGQVNLQADPGYQFRLSEGLKALDRQAAARGGLISGSALKAAQRYGQDMASQEYGQAYNRALTEYGAGVDRSAAGYGRNLTEYGLDVDRSQNQYARELDAYNARLNLSNTAYNRLAGQAGIGQTATSQLAGAAGQTGANISNIIGAGAAGQAAAIGAAGQARASGYVGAANALTGGASNYANYDFQKQFLNRLFPQQSTTGWSTADAANFMYNDQLPY
jgi:hypothetical protein